MVDISELKKGNLLAQKQKQQIKMGFVLACIGLCLLFLSHRSKEFSNSYDSSGDGDSYYSAGAGTEEHLSVHLDVDDPKVQDLIHQYLRQANPLGVPLGKAQALPSIRIEETAVKRKFYGGKGDKAHLGGFTIYDGYGVSPTTWKWMIQELNVKSMIDVGCGKGVSTSWFHHHGVKVLCLEGSHDAVQNTLLPDPANQVVEHDFSRGPYWPEDTYDAVWSVEFMEHVGRNYQYNYMQSFRKAALLFVSHSGWGGWHHVEVHTKEWWIEKMELLGFQYSEKYTNILKKVATGERDIGKQNPSNQTNWGPDGEPFNAQHVWSRMQVYVNPVVAALPQHAHLFANHGCFLSLKGSLKNRECGTSPNQPEESKLPKSFYPLELKESQDKAWLDMMKNHIAKLKAEQAKA